MYQQFFIQLLQHCENSKIAHKFRFKNPLYSLDASHIDLSLPLCEWAKVHESKASIKLTVGLNHSNTIPGFVALGDVVLKMIWYKAEHLNSRLEVSLYLVKGMLIINSLQK